VSKGTCVPAGRKSRFAFNSVTRAHPKEGTCAGVWAARTVEGCRTAIGSLREFVVDLHALAAAAAIAATAAALAAATLALTHTALTATAATSTAAVAATTIAPGTATLATAFGAAALALAAATFAAARLCAHSRPSAAADHLPP
jgi:hypothetical protein